MEHQGHSTPLLNCSSDAKSNSLDDSNELEMGPLVKQNLGAPMSNEEMKIRDELQNDIERDLEAEIKDEIYHLALRLHRLYQRQKERNTREASKNGTKSIYQPEVKNKTLSEVKINIKMEGGTRVEIKETKKEAPERMRLWTSRWDGGQAVESTNAKKFEWQKSLRSAKGSRRLKTQSNQRSVLVAQKFDHGGKKSTNSIRQRKRNLCGDRKALEQGWRF